MYGTKIFLASQDQALCKKIKSILAKEGYLLVGEAQDSSAALRGIRLVNPELVIIDENLAGIGGIEAAKIIEEDRLAPILLVTSTHHKDAVLRAREHWMFSFLLKPIEEAGLVSAIETALINFEKLRQLEMEITRLQETLTTRKLVDRAKGLLMDFLGLSEAEAFRRIQQQSMNKSLTIKKVAEAVILAYEEPGRKKKR